MNIEPKIFISPSYNIEFYNKCHDAGGKFCEGEGGPVSGKATDPDYDGYAYNDGITDLNTVYHVTSSDTAESIKNKGFQTGHGGGSLSNWGRGLYFSTDRKDSLGTYAATAHQRGQEVEILTVRTDVRNPLILETDRASSERFWNELKTIIHPETTRRITQDYENQRDPDDYYDLNKYAHSNLKNILDYNGNDGLLVRNPGGGGHGIGGETLVVTDASKVHPA